MLAAPRVGHQVDRFGGSTHEDVLLGLGRTDEPPHRLARLFVGVGRPRRQFVCRPVDVGILVGVEVRQPVDDHLGLLCGRGVVEPDQRLAVDGLLENRKVRPHRVHVEHLVLVRQLRHGVGFRPPLRRGCARRRRQEVVVVPVPGRWCAQLDRRRGYRIRPSEVSNRRGVSQPFGSRISHRGTRRSDRRRPGQHTRLRRDDAFGRHRERAEVGDTRRQVGIRHACGRPGGRGRGRRIGHAAPRGNRHRLRRSVGLRGGRCRNIDVGKTKGRHGRRERVRRPGRCPSRRGRRRGVRHGAARGDRCGLRRTVRAGPDTRRVQLAGQRCQLGGADG